MFRQRFLDWLVYIGVRLVAMFMLMFPINTNLKTARFLGWIWYRLIPRHRNRAREHLRIAYGASLSDEEIERITLRSMQQLTMLAVEMFFTPRVINLWTWARYVELKNIQPALDVLLSRRGAVMVTGHYGSWELLGFTLATLGFPLTAVMRPLDNPYLNDWLLEVRAKRGLQLLYKKGAARSANDILENGGLLCFIADQNAGRKGEFVDFFGKQASTYKSIGLLAMEYEVPIIVGYARRTGDNFHYELGCNRIIHPHEWQQHDNALHWLTQEYTRAIEDFVREDPEQYLWIHRRWKSRPRHERFAQKALDSQKGSAAPETTNSVSS
jgi:KDO2-lipid IV(A) lauroyltransferase